MEMIAMLGGLGAQPGFSPEGAAFASQISATKNVEELMVVVAAIDAASLRPDEKSALKVIAMEKRDSFDSIFRKPWYWVTVAAVLGVAWYHRDKIKRAVGLSGLGGYSEAKELIAKADDRIGGFGGDPPGNDIVEAFYYLGLAAGHAAEVRDPNIDADMMGANGRATAAWNRWTKKHCRL